MRIYGRRSGAMWCAAYALLCVCARPMKDRIGDTYVGSSSRSSDQETMASSYEFEELSASKSSIDDGLEELEEKEGLSTMRAITTKTRSNAVLLPLIIEPEAEMLPPGYKGVKPPGVSHMELTTFEKPRVGVSTRESARTRASGATDDDGDPDRSSDGFDWGGDAYYAASRRETQRLAGDDRGDDSTVVFETDWTNGVRQDGRRIGYVGSSDARESYSKNENRAKDREDGEAVKKRNGIHETDRAGEKITGYRDHYHKGELKKEDAGFYDNKRQGGRFNKRHGRYGERNDAAAAERTYAKEKSNDSGLADVETNKRQKFEKTRVSRDAQGQTTADSSGTWMDS